MNVLIVSDYFASENTAIKNDTVNPIFISWNDGRIKFAHTEFHAIIVDLNFSHKRMRFDPIIGVYLDLENWLLKLDKNEGFILVVICGYKDDEIFKYVIEEEIEDHQSYPGALNQDISGINKKIKHIPKKTYEFLKMIDNDTYSLFDYALEGKMFDPPVNPIFKEYFNNVENFYAMYPYTPNTNIRPISKTQGTGKSYISFEKKIGNSFIIYLPGYDHNKKQDAFDALISICNYYFEKQANVLKEAQINNSEVYIPEWVDKYKIARHIEIPFEIHKLEKEKDLYEKISFLLYGKDPRLEDSVKLLFEQLGMVVEKAQPGESFDLVCTYQDESLEFFVEVTGSSHSASGEKVKQIMDFRYNFPDKKIILLSNSFCNLDLPDRRNKEQFPSKVVNGLRPFDVLLMTTVDLYFQWKAVLDGDTNAVDILKFIQNSKGVFQWSK